jgi:hypothetical protein
MHGQGQHATLWAGGFHGAWLLAIHVGHADIHKNYIWGQLLSQVQSFFAILRLANTENLLRLQKGFEAGADNIMVVNQ